MPKTDYDYYQFLLDEGLSYSDAHRLAYGDYPGNTPREFAEHLRSKGKSYRDIAGWLQLRFGVGSKSVIHRWLNSDAMALHLKSKRKNK